jgi:hypothetical protein
MAGSALVTIAGFALEARLRLELRRVFRRQQLHRYVAPEPHLLCTEDTPHTTAPDFLLEAQPTDLGRRELAVAEQAARAQRELTQGLR